jgi:hypothetical protein
MGDASRLWLSSWEWGCCGDPFTVGDSVTLTVVPPDRGWLASTLGPELANTIDHGESHHEDGELSTVTGRVNAIWGVALRHTEREVRRDQPAAPLNSFPIEAGDGGVWRVSLGSASEFVTVREPIPGVSTLHEVRRVPWPPAEGEASDGALRDPGFSGYLVDLEIHDDSVA